MTATIHLVTTFDSDENATITIGKAHDTAKPGRDFTVNAVKHTITIPAGQTSGMVVFQLTPIATGSQNTRRITVTAFGNRLLYMEGYIFIEPVPPAATAKVDPTPQPASTEVQPQGTPTVFATPSPLPRATPSRVTPKEVATPRSVPTPGPSAAEPAARSDPAISQRSTFVAAPSRSARSLGCTDEDREDAPRVRSANPTGPYCILHFNLDTRCHILVYWEAQANGEYGYSVLYEGTQEVDFGDFHPQCTGHMYN
ncbi:MAG: hypothetical protein F4X83_07640 [Chloroflexi bacterium]|nr:hypothetical protein [Chloroflexota bacterium]